MKKSSFLSSFFSLSGERGNFLVPVLIDGAPAGQVDIAYSMYSSSYHMYLIKFNDVRLGRRAVWVYRLTHAVLPQPFFGFQTGGN